VEDAAHTEPLRQTWACDGGIASPKLSANSSSNAVWYRYYAGYADAFVADVVARLPEQTSNVLDPWNGSGTTTSVAATHGIDAQGFDLNPAAVVIAKARMLQADSASSLQPLTRELLAAVEADAPVEDDDLLLRWMTPRAAASVRRLAATFDRALIQANSPSDPARLASEISALGALFYLALFRVVRQTLSGFASSNPTWIRQKIGQEEKVHIDLRTLRPWLLRTMDDLAMTVGGRGVPRKGHARIKIAVGDSGSLPVADGSVDSVITSPPYCTRIDYAVATLPELATLGMREHQLRTLRDRLIGTPTRDGSYATTDVRWGAKATAFLHQVAEHGSHASRRYYLPFFSQYFAGMWRSLSEISRVVAPDRPIVLVVQDSYYKEIHADIPGVMSEMAAALGWNALPRRDFQVRTKANVNSNARKYRPTALATEAVLAFSR
jgi:hypothetical protein